MDQLVALLRALPDPHLVLDPDGVILAAHPTASEWFAPGHPLLRELAESDTIPDEHTVLVNGRPRVLALARSELPGELTSHLGSWPGRVHLVRLRDVTNDHETLHDVAEHARTLEDVMDALPALVVILDKDGRVVRGNVRWHVATQEREAWAHFAGVGADYLSVHDAAAARGNRRSGQLAQGIRDVLARRALAYETEYAFPIGHDEEETYRVAVTALDAHEGAVLQHIETSAVRREQRRYLEALAHFQAVFDHALDAIIICDDDGLIVSANKAAEQLYGLDQGLLLGHRLTEFMTERERKRANARWSGFLDHGTERGVVELQRPDGTVLLADHASRANFYPGRHLSVMRDVTTARRLEEHVRQTQKMEAIGQLTGGIAHDFNNLLTVVLGNANLLLTADVVADDDELSVGLREIVRATHRGSDMVRKLLAFGRQEQLHVDRQQLDVVVEDITATLRRVLPETIVVTHEVQGRIPPSMVDVTAVHQILLNLATNARDAMPGGGELRLYVQARDGAARGDDRDTDTGNAIAISAPASGAPASNQNRAEQHVLVRVSDTGSGIAPDDLLRIFEPFFTTKPIGEGTGLGMAMVYGLMSQLGGSVDVESTVGTGTAVLLRFPIADQPATPVTPPSTPVLEQGEGRILLVEDDASIRRLAVRLLVKAGYRVTQAADGGEGAVALRQSAVQGGVPFDLVLSDIVMPNGGWRAVATAVGEHAPGTRLLFMTGYAGREREIFAPEVPLAGPVLTKPWTPSDLLTAVRHALLSQRPDHSASLTTAPAE